MGWPAWLEAVEMTVSAGRYDCQILGIWAARVMVSLGWA